MSYVSNVLRPGENVLHHAKIHRIIYLFPLLLIFGPICAVTIAHQTHDQGKIALAAMFGTLLIPIGLIALFSGFLERLTTEIAVTNHRVIIKRGLIRRDTMEMNLAKIESVSVNQSVLGRILDFGNVDVRGTGSSIEDLKCVSAPISLRRSIEVHATA